MIDFLIEAFITPSPVWLGLGLGALVAVGAWYLLPESVDRASVVAWCIGLGVVGGLLFCLPYKKDEEN